MDFERVLAMIVQRRAYNRTHRDPHTRLVCRLADDVDASATIEKVRLFTQDKVELDKIFRVSAEAWLADGNKKALKRRMETYVYSPTSP